MITQAAAPKTGSPKEAVPMHDSERGSSSSGKQLPYMEIVEAYRAQYPESCPHLVWPDFILPIQRCAIRRSKGTGSSHSGKGREVSSAYV